MTDNNIQQTFYAGLRRNLDELKEQGLYKQERVLSSRQGSTVTCDDGRQLINLCANNYLGLSGDEALAQAAAKSVERYGYGLSSVRFICGTQTVHKQLERAIADFLGMEDAILYAAAFDANGGVFEPLFDENDAIISDALNHASLIDGIRLCKAARYRYAHNDMADLETQLRDAASKRHKLIVTDGVFSMDGTIAQLDKICDLADRYGALVLVDDSHATGFMGDKGRGSYAWNGVEVDFVTGTFGKALGGAMGGFICARKPVVELLKQRARPYLFSNALAPAVCGSSLEAIRIAQGEEGDALRTRLSANAHRYRGAMTDAGFTLLDGEHPIIPVMLGDAKLAQDFAARALELGVYVIGFSFPVVPRGQARIRTQMSAAHTFDQIDRTVEAFKQAGRELGVI